MEGLLELTRCITGTTLHNIESTLSSHAESCAQKDEEIRALKAELHAQMKSLQDAKETILTNDGRIEKLATLLHEERRKLVETSRDLRVAKSMNARKTRSEFDELARTKNDLKDAVEDLRSKDTELQTANAALKAKDDEIREKTAELLKAKEEASGPMLQVVLTQAGFPVRGMFFRQRATLKRVVDIYAKLTKQDAARMLVKSNGSHQQGDIMDLEKELVPSM